MISIKAFSALRPTEEWVTEVAALPYDVMSNEEAKKIVAQHPYSFLNIDKPEIHVDSQGDAPYIYARNLLDQMIQKDVFIQDKSCLYIYEQECPSNHQYGLACLVSVKDYQEGRVKKHEKTRTDKERDRILHISHCQAHTGPIFLIEDEWPNLGEYLESYTRRHNPLYEFKLEDEVRHRLYAIRELDIITELIEVFATMNALYIADGHHRVAAASKVAQDIGDKNNGANDFLAVVFPKEQLRILGYHRILIDQSGYTKEKLFKELNKIFEIASVDDVVFLPSQVHEYGMRYQKKWYCLKLKPEILTGKDIVQQLDVSILQDYVLNPIFKIEDPKEDSRIEFIPTLEPKDKMNHYIDEGWDIAFTMYPTSIDSLINVAKVDKLMPPKSTWFEPKLRSGLLIHQF